MSASIGLLRSVQRATVQRRGVAFEAAIIAAASKKVHMTLSKSSSGILSFPNSMEFSLDGESIAYKPPFLPGVGENYDDYAILESARTKAWHDSLVNVISIRLNRTEETAGL